MNSPEGTVELVGTDPSVDSRVDPGLGGGRGAPLREGLERDPGRPPGRTRSRAGDDVGRRAPRPRAAPARSPTRRNAVALDRGDADGTTVDSSGPTDAGDSAVTEPVEKKLKLIANHVEAIERELRGRGLRLDTPEGDRPGSVGDFETSRMMRTSERDRIVWERCGGIHASTVAEEAPYLGASRRTIERARIAEAERREHRVRPRRRRRPGPGRAGRSGGLEVVITT